MCPQEGPRADVADRSRDEGLEDLLASLDGSVEVSRSSGEASPAVTVAGRKLRNTASLDAVLFELDRPTFAQLFDEQPALAGLLSEALARRRGQLRAVAEANGNVVEVPEANWIFSRLRSIFGLRA